LLWWEIKTKTFFITYYNWKLMAKIRSSGPVFLLNKYDPQNKNLLLILSLIQWLCTLNRVEH
jgi:hypothetical protein